MSRCLICNRHKRVSVPCPGSEILPPVLIAPRISRVSVSCLRSEPLPHVLPSPCVSCVSLCLIVSLCLVPQIEDMAGLETARMNLSDLRRAMGREAGPDDMTDSTLSAPLRPRRQSMDNMDLLKVLLTATAQALAGL